MKKVQPFWALLLHYIRCNFRNILLPIHWGYCLVTCKGIPTTTLISTQKDYRYQECAKSTWCTEEKERKELLGAADDQ